MAAQERGWFGHDQIRLKILAPKGRRIEIGERHRDAGHRIDDVRQRKNVSRFILPGLEVADLGAADAQKNPEHFHIRRTLREHGVQAASTLLDPREVKAGRVADRLYEVGIAGIGVGPGNCGVFADGQRGDSVPEFVAEIGITPAAAITRPEIRVDGKLRQVRETAEGFIRSPQTL